MLEFLSSNRVTTRLLVLFAGCVAVYYQLDDYFFKDGLLVLPLLLLAVNLIAAFIYRPTLYTNIPLLVFHAALLFFVAFMAAGYLTYLKGTVELATGEEFSGRLQTIDKGLLHRYELDKVRFINLGFSIHYHKGIKRDTTENSILVADKQGTGKSVKIGDQVPLKIGSYRFYTTHNKGYAPVFTWIPSNGEASQTGSIHLPGYPLNEYQQALSWLIPGTAHEIWSMLVIKDEVLPEDRDFDFSIPRNHNIVVRLQDQRHVLHPGETAELEDGVLRYEKLQTWMGYKVHYDWTRPWLLATCIIGILSLALYFISQFELLRISAKPDLIQE